MGKKVFSNTAFTGVHDQATAGGTKSATAAAEEKAFEEGSLDPLVDPKGFAHLRGPIRQSLPRFVELPNGLFELTIGMPMPVESELDTTGSMGDNVDHAFKALPHFHELLATGREPVLHGYDVQIANAIFGDVKDEFYRRKFSPVLCRSQFEADERIAQQLTLMVPVKGGCSNDKEDPQFGLFGAAYFTAPRILEYGLKGYHFLVTDERTEEHVDYHQLVRVFGDTVLDFTKEMGFDFTPRHLPSTEEIVRTLITRSHAFFLQVGDYVNATTQWTHMYGKERVVMLPADPNDHMQTKHLHRVQSAIIGLTEGVLSLVDAGDWLEMHGTDKETAKQIVRAIAHIPLAEQRKAPNYGKLPKAGSLFRNKTDLWPLTPEEIVAHGDGKPVEVEPEAIDWA